MSKFYNETLFIAQIETIDHKRGKCTLIPSNPNMGSRIPDVLLPQILGAGNAKIMMGYKEGTRVIAGFTSGMLS